MARNWTLLVLLAMFPLAAVMPVGAQPPGAAQTAPEAVKAAPPQHPRTLQEIADEIVWNPEQQGVLLIVAPRQTFPASSWSRRVRKPDGTYSTPPELTLPIRGNEGLRLNQLEAYFERQVVPCGDVTVLAPAMMTVLNYKNLPKPSAYAGFKPADSFRLLQASLAEAQWQRLASSQGLGYGDMTDNDQRELFLASLPPQITVQKYGNQRSENIIASEAQRRGIRMYMARQMNWTFRTPKYGGISFGRSRDDTVTTLTVQDLSDTDWEERQKQSFGVELASKIPARAKPGDLSFTWEALDAPVQLDGVKTLGDLVDRVREVTRVEVFADPRYANLPVLMRGDSARAGNLLKACARAVTGAYRKVGTAFVLTDDVTGLGVRHALVQEWVSANASLASTVDKKIAKSLKEAKPDRFMDYADGDPLKPSDALLKRYTDYRASLRQPQKAGDPPRDWNKQFSTSDLPPKAQEMVRKQAADMQKGQYGDEWKDVSTETVGLSFSATLKWDVPGIGVADAPYNADVIDVSEDNTVDQQAPKFEPRPLLLSLKTRVLFVGAGKPEQITNTIAAAKHAGFTEVWVETDASHKDNLTTAIHTAQQAQLAIRAVVRAGRCAPAKGANRSGIDTNLLGETSTEYLGRTLASGIAPRSPWDYSNREQIGPNPMLLEMQRQRDRGDWLDPQSPHYVQSVEEAVAAVAKTPGLAGIVVSDLVPPGYAAASQPYFGSDGVPPGAQGGYSEASRLEFLRKFHVDPLDLSLTGSNNIGNSYYLRFRQSSYTQLELPWFPDYGPNAQSSTINGQKATELGVGNAFQEWNRFRADAVDRALTRLQKKFTDVSLPVWYYKNSSNNISGFGFFIENRDKIVPETDKPNPAPAPDQSYNPFAASATQRARSSTLLLALDPIPFMNSIPYPGVDAFLMMTSFLFDPKSTQIKGWDGIVIDMSSDTLPSVAAHIAALPVPVPTAEPGKTPGKVPTSKRP